MFRDLGTDLLTGWIALCACKACSSFRLFLSISRLLCFLVTMVWTIPLFSNLSRLATRSRAFYSYCIRSKCNFLWIRSVCSSSQCVTRVFFWYLWCFEGLDTGTGSFYLVWLCCLSCWDGMIYFSCSVLEEVWPKPPGVVKSIDIVESPLCSRKWW